MLKIKFIDKYGFSKIKTYRNGFELMKIMDLEVKTGENLTFMFVSLSDKAQMYVYSQIEGQKPKNKKVDMDDIRGGASRRGSFDSRAFIENYMSRNDEAQPDASPTFRPIDPAVASDGRCNCAACNPGNGVSRVVYRDAVEFQNHVNQSQGGAAGTGAAFTSYSTGVANAIAETTSPANDVEIRYVNNPNLPPIRINGIGNVGSGGI